MKKLILMMLCIVLGVSLIACAPAQEAVSAEDAGPDEATETVTEPESTEDAGSDEATEAATESEYKDFMADGKIKVTYVCKFLKSVWFSPKSDAMAAKAEELGIEYTVVDANNDEELCLGAVESAIMQEADAIIVTAVNDQLLPTIAQKCHEAGVVLMTTEDPGFDELGDPIPHVGLNDYALGEASAKNLLKSTMERGFFDDPSQLRIVMLDTPKIASMHQRILAAQDVIKAEYPDLPESSWIISDVDDSLPDNVIKQFSSIYQANSDAKYWIILGGDEGSVQGTYPIMDENGVDFKNVALTMVAGSTVITDYMALDEDVANAYFFCGLLPSPAGDMTMKVLGTFLIDGGELPLFTGYDLNAYDGSNFTDYVDAMALSMSEAN